MAEQTIYQTGTNEQVMPGWAAERSVVEDMLLASRVNKLSHIELDMVWVSLDLVEKRKHIFAVLIALDERAKKGHCDGD